MSLHEPSIAPEQPQQQVLAELHQQLAELEAVGVDLSARLELSKRLCRRLLRDLAEPAGPDPGRPGPPLPRPAPAQARSAIAAPRGRQRPTTLPKAIIRIFLELETVDGHEPELRGCEIIAELRDRGWMPKGFHGENGVWNAIGKLKRRGELVHTGYGTYALAPKIRAFHAEGHERSADPGPETHAARGANNQAPLEMIGPSSTSPRASSTSKEGFRLTRV